VGAMIEHARDGLEHFAYELVSTGADSGDARARALEEIARLAARIPGETKREVVVAKVAAKIGVETSVIMRALSRAARGASDPRPSYGRPSPPPPEPAAPAPPPPSNAPLLDHELDLLALVADHPSLLATPQANKAFSLLTDDRLRDMYSAARAGASLPVLAPDRLPPHAIKVLLAGTYAQHPKPEAVLDAKVQELEAAARKQRTLSLERQLAAAKKAGDVEEIRRLVLEVMNTRKQVD